MRRLKPFVVRSLVVAVTVGTAALSGIAHQRPPDTFAARSYDGDDDRDRDREQYRDHDDDDRDRDRDQDRDQDREEEHEHHKGSATHASPIVTNQSSNTVSVIDTDSDEVVETIRKVGQKPHGIAITGDGRKVLVSQFLALKPANDPRPLTESEGADDGREGRVTVIDGYSHDVIGTVALNPLADVGAAFKSDGNTLKREPLTQTFDNVTGAFPNLLESVLIWGNIAYVPGTCSSPNGPFRFNVNVQSCLSGVDITNGVAAFTTLNMNAGVNFEPVGVKLFNTNPFAIAFKQSKPEGFVALGATDRLLRVTLDNTGLPSINPPANAGDPGNIVRIQLKDPQDIVLLDPNDTIGGKNPRGLVINSSDTRAYVMDFLSRDVAVVDISGDVPALYHHGDPDAVGRSPGTSHGRGDRSSREAALQLGDRTGGCRGELAAAVGADVRHRMGHVLQLPSQWADRQRDVDVRGRPTAGDLDGEHVSVRRGGDRERRARAARIAYARAQLVGGSRRSAGFRAQHPGGVWRRRAHPRHCRRRGGPGERA